MFWIFSVVENYAENVPEAHCEGFSNRKTELPGTKIYGEFAGSRLKKPSRRHRADALACHTGK